MCCRRRKRHVTEVSLPCKSHKEGRYNSSKHPIFPNPRTVTEPRSHSFADSTLLYPVGVSALSVLALLVQSILHLRAQGQKNAQSARLGSPQAVPLDETRSEGASPSAFARHVKEHGGTVIFAYNAIRAASTLALLGLYIYSALTISSHHTNADADAQGFETAFRVATCVAYVSAMRP